MVSAAGLREPRVASSSTPLSPARGPSPPPSSQRSRWDLGQASWPSWVSSSHFYKEGEDNDTRNDGRTRGLLRENRLASPSFWGRCLHEHLRQGDKGTLYCKRYLGLRTQWGQVWCNALHRVVKAGVPFHPILSSYPNPKPHPRVCSAPPNPMKDRGWREVTDRQRLALWQQDTGSPTAWVRERSKRKGRLRASFLGAGPSLPSRRGHRGAAWPLMPFHPEGPLCWHHGAISTQVPLLSTQDRGASLRLGT